MRTTKRCVMFFPTHSSFISPHTIRFIFYSSTSIFLLGLLTALVRQIASPGLTSASTATSDEATLSPFPIQPDLPGQSLDPKFLAPSSNTVSDEQLRLRSAPSPTPSTVRSNNKLKKSRKDGYESASEAKERKRLEKEEKRLEKEEKKRAKKAKKNAGDETEYETDGGYMSEAAAGRKKSPKKKSKKASDDAHAPAGDDYDTDGGYMSSSSRPKPFRSKSSIGKKSMESGDASDGGYVSDKKKRSLFRIGSSKGSKKGSTPEAAEAPPPVPMIPLPIAERFALTLDMPDFSSRSNTPVPPSVSSRFGSFDTFTSEESRGGTSFSPTSTDLHSPIPPVSEQSTLPWAQDDIAVGGTRPTPPERQNTNESSQTTASEPVPLSTHPTPSRRVRWTPSTQSTKRPNISLPLTSLTSSPDSGSSSPEAQNDLYRQLSISASASARRIPSPLHLNPRPMPSPAGSEFSIVTPGDYLPTPSSGDQSRNRSPARSPRAHLATYDLPPPSPPPQGPLPLPPPTNSPPSPSHLRNPAPTRPIPAPPPSYPRPIGNGINPPSRAPSPGGLIQRGRQSPFPTRPILPAEESRDLVRRTSFQTPIGGAHGRMPMRSASAMSIRQDMAVGGGGGGERSRAAAPPGAWDTRGGRRYGGSEESALDYDYEEEIDAMAATPGISVVNASEDGDDEEEYEARMRDQEPDEDIRPDVAQFFFASEEDNTTTSTSGRTRSIFVESFNEEDDASVYPPTSVGEPQGGYLVSPYEDGDRTSVWSTGTGTTGGGFLDEEKSEMVRENFVERVGQMYGPGGREREREVIPPVPALPRRF